ncbi:MAG: hypothetical protein ABSB61_04620 [Anaerolineales bacterium]
MALPSLIVRELTVADARSKVMVWPLAIIASSLAFGTCPHDHVPTALQFPLPVEVHVAAYAGITGNTASASITIMMAAMNLAVD